jgi:hypothetical protein
MKRVLLVVPVLAALTAGACNNSSTNSTSPTPATPSKTETFAGAVPVGGSSFNNFVVALSGEVITSLTAAGPPATIFMGVGIGTPTATTCPHTVTENRAGIQAGPNPIGDFMLNAGTYCIDIFDIGNAQGPVTYSVTVAHP